MKKSCVVSEAIQYMNFSVYTMHVARLASSLLRPAAGSLADEDPVDANPVSLCFGHVGVFFQTVELRDGLVVSPAHRLEHAEAREPASVWVDAPEPVAAVIGHVERRVVAVDESEARDVPASPDLEVFAGSQHVSSDFTVTRLHFLWTQLLDELVGDVHLEQEGDDPAEGNVL